MAFQNANGVCGAAKGHGLIAPFLKNRSALVHVRKNVTDARVDSYWTLWTDWSPCSVTCRSGTQARSRNCIRKVLQNLFAGLNKEVFTEPPTLELLSVPWTARSPVRAGPACSCRTAVGL